MKTKKEVLELKDFEHKDFPISESTEALFGDISDVLMSDCLGLDSEQIDLALEMIANTLFLRYAVLYTPDSTHLSLQ